MRVFEQLFIRRPRILNVLHAIHLARPTSQTIEIELEMLERYARNAECALEIGSALGVSAARIASVISKGGTLYCVDPWPSPDGEINPCYAIFRRHLQRAGMSDKVRILQKLSSEVYDLLPDELDFVFVDGD